jgi:hypothetical protein
MLQRKIATLKRHAAAAAAGGAAAAGEENLALTAASIAAADGSGSEVPGSWPRGEGYTAGGSRGRGVAAAVARDRAIARLGLGIVEEYPRDVLIDLIQVGCYKILCASCCANVCCSLFKEVSAVDCGQRVMHAFVCAVRRCGLGATLEVGVVLLGCSIITPSHTA